MVEAGGTDTDDDGIVDVFQDDDANGFDDAIAAAPLPLPDTDGDGTADVLDVADVPGTDPTDPAAPALLTGVNGVGGCVLHTGNTRIDPTLPALTLMFGLFLLRRRKS